MLVFIGWSGERSKALASLLRTWLGNIFHAVRPWMSDHDIEAGAPWESELFATLREARFAVVCVTGDNLDSAWLQFEAGAACQALDTNRVCPLLLDNKKEEITSPLKHFQMLGCSEEDFQKLIRSINAQLPSDQQRTEDQLRTAFSKWWSDLAEGIARVPAATTAKTKRELDDVANETLLLAREQVSQLANLSSMVESIKNRGLFSGFPVFTYTPSEEPSQSISAILRGYDVSKSEAEASKPKIASLGIPPDVKPKIEPG